ncbi:MAG: site-2 protease family protein, partial [Simkaniaceae bacterium]|nr:site-2 protease family protein [Simkaniaceae bacterium]
MTQAKRSIPIRISPFFFLTAGLIGYYISRNFTGMLIWIGVIFISIIVHEFGHALISRAFGQNPQIELTAFGGVTYATQPKISLPKEFLVVLAGPCFGFSLFLIGEALILLKVFSNPLILSFLDIIVTVNFLWTILNLIPVLPLDGGQLMRIILEGVFGYKGRHGAFIASMIVSLLIAMAFIFFQN